MEFRLQKSLSGTRDRSAPDWEEEETRKRKKVRILDLDTSGIVGHMSSLCQRQTTVPFDLLQVLSYIVLISVQHHITSCHRSLD